MGETCHAETSPSSPPLLKDGNLVFQAHHVGWIIASFFTIVAIITSFWLVNKHLQWYTNKREQRYIIRLLFMVPIYAVISLASYFFWNHATPLLLVRDAYESTVLTAFFYLLLTYLSPNPDEQREIFRKVGLSREVDAERVARGEEPTKWMFPFGFVKYKPADGLYFLQLMKWGVLQYCVIRPLTTLAAVILNYLGWYCEGSFNPKWGYVYIIALVSLSVSIAMYCLLQLYFPVSQFLAPQKPILKLFAIKAVVFLTFWQSTFLSVLAMLGVIKDTTYMTSEDINIGIGALLETFEMMLFAFLHIKAFSYKPYRPFHDPKSKLPPPTPTPRLRSLGHALDFRETFREIRIGWVYIIDKIRGREPTPDRGARRFGHYESAFGRPRPSNLPTSKAMDDKAEQRDLEKGLLSPRALAANDIPWLKLPGDERREKSEDLEIQIERELERRGYGSHIPGRGHIGQVPETRRTPSHKPQRSWWRSVYSRVSQSAAEAEDEERLTSKPPKRKKTQSRHRSRDMDADYGFLTQHDMTFDDPPPPSIFAARNHCRIPGEDQLDIVAPLSVFDEHRSSRQNRPSHKMRHSTRLTSPPVAPQSSYYTTPAPPMPQSPIDGESLFGRIFPPSTNPPSSAGHGPLSDTELPSVSTHGVAPSRATPPGRLIPATPQIVGQSASGPSRSRAFVTPQPQRAVTARSVEAFPSSGEHWTSMQSIDKAPALTLNTQPDGLLFSPLSADIGAHEFGEKMNRRSGNLGRQSAQIYSPESPSRAKRRQSVDISGVPQLPQSSYSPPHTDRGRTSYRKPQHSHNNYEEELRHSGYNDNNMRSDMTQPSHSGTRHTQKYPTVMPSKLVMPPSLAAPGLPMRQISNPQSYPRYGSPGAGSSTPSVNRTPPNYHPYDKRTTRP
ncbi:hypothetical protein MIND_00032700 [Mycena indigotica]|uniref:DUF300-domain-containing protein n=1 Tax=Mycena indigotica TaxID=2126181 RepID=A0A8H6WHK6_9AGAR|nr:uncharacterized protein MIND_00032700 [Mycena indigotica]KAF7315183.1 hypothetical protein MIND_00032700 [Mycena indigotica]